MASYFRLTLTLQFFAALNMVLAFFLPWEAELGNAVGLLKRPFEGFSIPLSVVSEWWLLWLMIPYIVFMVLRGFLGLVDTEVLGRKTAFLLGCLSVIVMAWFYVSFVDNLEIGFWITAVALGISMLLLVVEFTMPTTHPTVTRISRLEVDHPERIAEGLYKLCPHCQEPNKPEARKCEACGMMLFPEDSDV